MDIERLRQICLSFPHVAEDVKWGSDLCFCIGEKMFAVTGLEAANGCASFKVLPEEFENMISREGVLPAPYLARYKWVVADFTSMKQEEWVYFLQQSYALVKEKLPASVLKKLG